MHDAVALQPVLRKVLAIRVSDRHTRHIAQAVNDGLGVCGSQRPSSEGGLVELLGPRTDLLWGVSQQALLQDELDTGR